MDHKQLDFSGGLNRLEDASKIGLNEYFFASNLRIRNRGLEAIRLPVKLDATDGLPSGNFQGCYGADTILLAFVDGKAYYKNEAVENSLFVQLVGIALNADAPVIYVELIPASTVNYVRTLVADSGNTEVSFSTSLNGSPSAIFVTDGVTQPILIFPDGNWRATKTYTQWSTVDREYVPKGIFPCYVDGILYLSGRDNAGRYTRIYRSVTGRPIDFIVQVTLSGDKAHPTDEELGGAPSTAYRVAYEELTALNRIVVSDGAFLAGTSKGSYLVVPRFDNLIFGEPTFSKQFLFSTGPVNQFSVVDILGDTALIDGEGLRSFNAVAQLKVEGKNSLFSQKIFRLFSDVIQTHVATTSFDNYAFFAVNTVYGPGVIVFDTLSKVFVSVDLYPGVGLIRQFAELKVNGDRKLYFMTDDGIYLAFGGATANARFYLGELSTGDDKTEHKGKEFHVLLDLVKESGTLQITLFADRKPIVTKSVTVNQLIEESTGVENIPYPHYITDSCESFPFNFEKTPFASRLGFLVEWNCQCMLSSLLAVTEAGKMMTTHQRKGNLMVSSQEQSSYVLAITGSDGVDTEEKALLVKEIKTESPDFILGTGNHNYPAGALATQVATLRNYWGYDLRVAETAFFTLGKIDLDTLNGQAALEYYLNGRYYVKELVPGLIDLFVINSGINTALATVEPDGINATSVQAYWLRDRLSESTAKWKIVLGHLANTWPLQLWGASFYINGKGKYFERLLDSDGFNHITIGLGGHSIDSLPSDGAVDSYNDSNAFLRLTVDNFNCRFDLRNNKETLRSFVIHA